MTGYVYGAARTTTDLRKAGRLIHDLRRDLAQATTERDAAQVELRRTAAQRDLLERHIEEMRQARTASHSLQRRWRNGRHGTRPPVSSGNGTSKRPDT